MTYEDVSNDAGFTREDHYFMTHWGVGVSSNFGRSFFGNSQLIRENSFPCNPRGGYLGSLDSWGGPRIHLEKFFLSVTHWGVGGWF